MSDETDPISYRGWTIQHNPSPIHSDDWEFFKIPGGATKPASPQRRAPSGEAAKWQIDEMEEEEATRRDVN